MINIVRAATCLGLLAACSPALSSDLYRCDMADRRVVYQGTQCDIGAAQKAIDSKNARREQIRKTMDQERQQKRQKEVAANTAG